MRVECVKVVQKVSLEDKESFPPGSVPRWRGPSLPHDALLVSLASQPQLGICRLYIQIEGKTLVTYIPVIVTTNRILYESLI